MPDLWSPSVLEEGLRDAVAEVLEKMFFIRILEDTQDAEAVSESGVDAVPVPEIAVRLNFHGQPSGRLSLHLNRDAAKSIAADFLGEDEAELERRQIEEVVCELTNMICGAVLSRVESTVTFRLDPPVIGTATDSDLELPETAMHAFPIGSGELTAKIWMEAPACGSTEKSAS